jgi:hypothetical protein
MFARNVHSQNGEDGILEKIMDVIGTTNKWCVEFGAWDGQHLSNTFHLIESSGFNGVLIEGSRDRFQELSELRHRFAGIVPLNAYVGFSASDNLDTLLAGTPIPREFDLLSIDVDGNDYHIWKACLQYRPRVVVIEYNPTVPSSVEFVQPADMRLNQGASIASLVALGLEKNYELVAVTERNCIFVDHALFPAFAIADNSVEALRPNEDLVTWLFSGYDGTVFIRGNCTLPWHRVPYRVSRMQQIWRPFRIFPSNHEGLARFVARHYRSFRKRLR